MYIYLMAIIASLACLCLSEHIIQKTGKRFFLILSVLIPAVLAGMRDLKVGTDTAVYKIAYFDAAQTAEHFKSLFPYIQSQSFEIGFMGWCYFVGKIFGSFQIFLFLTELVTLIFVYKSIYTAKHKIGLYFPLLIFYLLYYNSSFNILRQTLACSIALYALSELVINKKKQYIVLVFCAAMIHYTSLVCILIYFLYFVLCSIKNFYKLKIFMMLVILGLYANLGRMDAFLQNIHVLPERYIGFFEKNLSTSSFNISFILFKSLPMFTLLFYTLLVERKRGHFAEKPFQVGEVLMIICAFSFFFYSGNAIERMLLYLEMFSMVIMVPLCIQKCTAPKSKSALFMKGSVIAVFGVYWYWYYIFMGYAGTVPYRMFR